MTLSTRTIGQNEINTDTGVGAISSSVTPNISTKSGRRKIVSVMLHLGTAPSSAGSITLTLSPSLGAAYNALLSTQSLVGVTNYIWTPPSDMYLYGTDALVIVYTNTDGVTWGMTVTLEGKL